MSSPPFSPDAPISEFIPLSTHVSPTVLKTTGGDYLLTWRLEGLPFVGREEWELEHRHNTFKALGLDLLNQPDLAAEPANAAKIAVQYWKERYYRELVVAVRRYSPRFCDLLKH